MSSSQISAYLSRKLSSVEWYDEATETWSLLGNMPQGPRIGASAAVFKGQLFVVGGFHKLPGEDTNPVLDYVECYDLLRSR